MDLSIALLGEAFHKSPSYLGKLFKKEMDCGILDYINEVRIQNAKTMLKETSLSIQEVSGKAGFSRDVYKRQEVTSRLYQNARL